MIDATTSETAQQKPDTFIKPIKIPEQLKHLYPKEQKYTNEEEIKAQQEATSPSLSDSDEPVNDISPVKPKRPRTVAQIEFTKRFGFQKGNKQGGRKKGTFNAKDLLLKAIKSVEKEKRITLFVHAVRMAFKDKAVLLKILDKIIPVDNIEHTAIVINNLIPTQTAQPEVLKPGELTDRPPGLLSSVQIEKKKAE